MSHTITIRRPDDMHLHLRDGINLQNTVNDACKQFRRAVIMPNLVPPVTNLAQAQEYQKRILAHLPLGAKFTPLMTLYLTDQTSSNDIEQAHASGVVVAAKLYPAGATTNSAAGVTNLQRIYPVLETMAQIGMPLLVHGEIADFNEDIFGREQKFIQTHLAQLVQDFPKLKIVLEHITTLAAVNFVGSARNNIAATITPQHLLYNRNHMLVGGIKPHLYCLPILKKDTDQQALIQAAISGNPKFFLGTDSAPHAQNKKEAACGCAGCYSAFHALELYTEVFAQNNALDKLEGFASTFGAKFYGLELNQEFITIKQEQWQVPHNLPYGDEQIIPIKAGENLTWQISNA